MQVLDWCNNCGSFRRILRFIRVLLGILCSFIFSNELEIPFSEVIYSDVNRTGCLCSWSFIPHVPDNRASNPKVTFFPVIGLDLMMFKGPKIWNQGIFSKYLALSIVVISRGQQEVEREIKHIYNQIVNLRWNWSCIYASLNVASITSCWYSYCFEGHHLCGNDIRN